MATYTQSNSNVSSSYYNYFLSQIPIGKDYIICATDTDYICVYGDHVSGSTFKDTTILSILRQYNQGQVNETNESTTTVNINYDYYTYSNVGYGTYLVSPLETHNNITISHYTFTALIVLLLFYIGFNTIKKRWIR